jgi:hypothetical protein
MTTSNIATAVADVFSRWPGVNNATRAGLTPLRLVP